MSVTLEEVEELARDSGVDHWELASRFAQRMLPQIFRPDDPVLAVPLPTETRLELESLLESLPAVVFTADDSLGWVYQFWQSKKKDEVNASGEQITGETLPAVTQLFTEHYMVLFLLHNTVANVNDARLYRTLDALLPHKEALETFLKNRLGELFDLEDDLLLYDITSTFFEGKAEGNPLAQRGYSRDQRSDGKQVCIGLVVSRCGMPLGYEVFAGGHRPKVGPPT